MEKIDLTLPLPLYRGIATEGEHKDEMVYGSLLVTEIEGKKDLDIVPFDKVEYVSDIPPISPETLGMYIGKEDINGKKIFTGDVLEDKCDNNLTKYFLVVYSKENFRFALCSSLSSVTSPWHISKYISLNKIIGNIHENPELLKLFPHLQA